MDKYRVLANNVSSMTRGEWLAIRRKGLGGSDTAAVCGLDPWRGPLSVYLSKVGQTPNGETSEIQQWGLDLEGVIAKAFTRQTGFEVKACDKVLQHESIDHMLVNLDGWVQDTDEPDLGVWEAKNVGEYNSAKWDDGAIPDHYQCQLQHAMAVTGATYAWISPLLGGNRLRPVKLLRDDRFIASLIKIEQNFWNLIETKTPPPIDGSEDASRVLKYIYPRSTEESIEIEESLYDQLKTARLRRVDAELEERRLENAIKEQMKDAGAAHVFGNPKPVITWRGTVTKRVNVALMEQAEPEICAKYITESTSRRFLVK